jgi:hypothetical protein
MINSKAVELSVAALQAQSAVQASPERARLKAAQPRSVARLTAESQAQLPVHLLPLQASMALPVQAQLQPAGAASLPPAACVPAAYSAVAAARASPLPRPVPHQKSDRLSAESQDAPRPAQDVRAYRKPVAME